MLLMAPDGAIPTNSGDPPDRHRSTEPMPSENLNSNKENSAPVPTECPPSAARSKHAKTGIYVKAAPGLRLRDKKVERLARKMRTVMEWLQPSDMPAARAWAELEYLSGQVYAALRSYGVVNPSGEARRLLDDYRKLRLAQAIFARELGMTPAARMAIKANSGRAPYDARFEITEADAARVVEVAKSYAESTEPD
jgi:hypothetical protein